MATPKGATDARQELTPLPGTLTWSGTDGENSNQINSLPMGIEELKL